jgi:hypothetical protein
MNIEELISELKQKSAKKNLCWMVCYGERPLQGVPPGGSGAHVMIFSSPVSAQAFITGRGKYFQREPLSIVTIDSQATLKKVTNTTSADPDYTAPPCGLVLDFNYTSGAAATSLPPAKVAEMSAKEIAEVLNLTLRSTEVPPVPVVEPLITQPAPAGPSGVKRAKTAPPPLPPIQSAAINAGLTAMTAAELAGMATRKETTASTITPIVQSPVTKPNPAPKAPAVPQFFTKTTNPGGTYEIYRGTDAESARQFLLSKKVTQAQYYIKVETPEGNWGMDKEGLYLERLLPWQLNVSAVKTNGTHNPLSVSMFGVQFAKKGMADNFIVDVECGSCGFNWRDGVRYQNDTVVKCPKCKTLNKIDSRNITMF